MALADLADELGVRVTILGTPAEEAYGGKVDLLNAGAFANAAAAMMVHPSPTDVVDPGVLAVRHLDVEFHGKDSHAAFAPQLGINALDAFVQAYVNVSTLRQAYIRPTRSTASLLTVATLQTSSPRTPSLPGTFGRLTGLAWLNSPHGSRRALPRPPWRPDAPGR